MLLDVKYRQYGERMTLVLSCMKEQGDQLCLRKTMSAQEIFLIEVRSWYGFGGGMA